MTEILTDEELVVEGKAILRVYDLAEVSFTREGAQIVWLDYFAERDDEITHMAVRESIKGMRERYDLRKLNWLRNWYVRYSEILAVTGKYPNRMHYGLFFTIRGPANIVNTKNTSLYQCLMYLRDLELRRKRPTSINFGVRSSQRTQQFRKRVREYMRTHPEEVERVKAKYVGR